VGPRAGLDTETTGKILCPRRESNTDRPVVQPVVRHDECVGFRGRKRLDCLNKERVLKKDDPVPRILPSDGHN
jgi:hypothetical protein